MKLGVDMYCTKISAEFEFGVIAPWVRAPQNVTFGYDIGKISFSAGCLVECAIFLHALGQQRGPRKKRNLAQR